MCRIDWIEEIISEFKDVILTLQPMNSRSAPSSGLRPPSPPISGEKGHAIRSFGKYIILHRVT